MKKQISCALPLFGVIALLAAAPLALAAKPQALVPGEAPQRAGRIEFLDLGKNQIVINDREYQLSGTVTVNGKSGARYSLSRGMRVTFSVAPDNGRNVVNEIWTGQ